MSDATKALELLLRAGRPLSEEEIDPEALFWTKVDTMRTYVEREFREKVCEFLAPERPKILWKGTRVYVFYETEESRHYILREKKTTTPWQDALDVLQEVGTKVDPPKNRLEILLSHD